MFTVDYSPLVSEGEQAVFIGCSREDAAELFKWLNSVNTGPMNDQQFMYFCSFKDKLQEVMKSANAPL